jgi:hypothetical protein
MFVVDMLAYQIIESLVKACGKFLIHTKVLNQKHFMDV